MSLRQGIVPYAWKQCHITPVHKGGSTDDPSHYRLIAVVSVVAKVLEKIVATQLSSYLEEHGLLNSQQGAYRHGKSTEDILLVAVDAIIHQMNLSVLPFRPLKGFRLPGPLYVASSIVEFGLFCDGSGIIYLIELTVLNVIINSHRGH